MIVLFSIIMSNLSNCTKKTKISQYIFSPFCEFKKYELRIRIFEEQTDSIPFKLDFRTLCEKARLYLKSSRVIQV